MKDSSKIYIFLLCIFILIVVVIPYPKESFAIEIPTVNCATETSCHQYIQDLGKKNRNNFIFKDYNRAGLRGDKDQVDEVLKDMIATTTPQSSTGACTYTQFCTLPEEGLKKYKLEAGDCRTVAANSTQTPESYRGTGCSVDVSAAGGMDTLFTFAKQAYDIKNAQDVAVINANKVTIKNLLDTQTQLNQQNTDLIAANAQTDAQNNTLTNQNTTLSTKNSTLQNEINVVAADASRDRSRADHMENSSRAAFNANIRIAAFDWYPWFRCLQKRFDNRYYTLLYKYVGNTGYDPYTQFINRWSNINTGSVCDPEFIYNRQPYRNDELMRRVFDYDGRQYSIMIEVYNSKDRVAQLQSKCGRNTMSYEQPLGNLKFIKPANQWGNYVSWFNHGYYRNGTIRGMEQNWFQFNGNWMQGDDYWRRRWFISQGYYGCNADKVLMCIPMRAPCNWDRWATGNIIMAHDKPIQVTGLSQDEFNCRYVGDVMCVYACLEENQNNAFGTPKIATSC